MDLDDLTVCLLHLLQGGEVVPESRASNDGVRSEDLHAVDWRLWVLLSRLAATDDQILVHLIGSKQSSSQSESADEPKERRIR